MGLKKPYWLALLLMAAVALVPGPATAAAPVAVAHGLDSPRGVAFFHDQLVVAEAGHGGPHCVGTPGTFGAFCFGLTSQISWVDVSTGSTTPLVKNLFSGVEWHGGPAEAIGVDGISPWGGRLYGILGLFPQVLDDVPCSTSACEADKAVAKSQAGRLISTPRSGEWHSVASVGAFDYDYTANIPGQEHDANPYGVLAIPGGALVADAGSNTLNLATDGGHNFVIHHFPWKNPDPRGFPSDEVPTCVAISGDAIWVASLSGHLYRLEGPSATLVPNALLKHVTGCAADPRGNVYFVNMWTPTYPTPFSGTIVKFFSETGASSVVAGGINFPNMDTVGPDGNLYFSADSVCPSSGIPGLCPKGGSLGKLAL